MRKYAELERERQWELNENRKKEYEATYTTYPKSIATANHPPSSKHQAPTTKHQTPNNNQQLTANSQRPRAIGKAKARQTG